MDSCKIKPLPATCILFYQINNVAQCCSPSTVLLIVPTGTDFNTFRPAFRCGITRLVYNGQSRGRVVCRTVESRKAGIWVPSGLVQVAVSFEAPRADFLVFRCPYLIAVFQRPYLKIEDTYLVVWGSESASGQLAATHSTSDPEQLNTQQDPSNSLPGAGHRRPQSRLDPSSQAAGQRSIRLAGCYRERERGDVKPRSALNFQRKQNIWMRVLLHISSKMRYLNHKPGN